MNSRRAELPASSPACRLGPGLRGSPCIDNLQRPPLAVCQWIPGIGIFKARDDFSKCIYKPQLLTAKDQIEFILTENPHPPGIVDN